MPRLKPYSPLLPWLIALVVLLVAWFVPLPKLVSGEETLVAPRMPQIRANVQVVETNFRQAQTSYLTYVKTHDMAAVLANMQGAISSARCSNDPAELLAVRDAAMPINEYTAVLYNYAQAGERYFPTLRGYDNDLMGWTRSLGADSERLHKATFPIADWLKLYPVPIGSTLDPPLIAATSVAAHTASLKAYIAALNPDPDPRTNTPSVDETLDAISGDVNAIWADGRSIERFESLHNEYARVLQVYDGQLQLVAANSSGNAPLTGRVAFATALDLLIGAVTLGGLAALFMPRRRARGQEPQS